MESWLTSILPQSIFQPTSFGAYSQACTHNSFIIIHKSSPLHLCSVSKWIKALKRVVAQLSRSQSRENQQVAYHIPTHSYSLTHSQSTHTAVCTKVSTIPTLSVPGRPDLSIMQQSDLITLLDKTWSIFIFGLFSPERLLVRRSLQLIQLNFVQKCIWICKSWSNFVLMHILSSIIR